MNLHRIAKAIVVLSALFAGFAAKADLPVGVTTVNTDAPERTQALTMTLWYPAHDGGKTVRVGENMVFEGVAGQQDAPIREGTFPVVLISLGGMRAAPNLAGWIGADLAARGVVAVVVQPPRLGPGDARLAVEELWKRPADLATALSALEDNPAWAKHLDSGRVGAVGFFLGGTSVLSLVGARLNADSYTQSCDEGGTGMDCAWFADAGVDLHKIDVTRVARSNLDPRIKVAVAIDPELSTSFTVESLSKISKSVKVVNLGRPDGIAPGLEASMLATTAPQIEYSRVPHATQFSAFAVCKPKGAGILAQDGGNKEICDADAGVGRKSIHAELAELIAGFLNRHLGSNP